MRPERPPTVLGFALGETFSQTRWRSLEVPAAGKPAVDPYTFPRTARCGAKGEGADGDVRLGWRRLAGCVGLAGRGAQPASTRPRRMFNLKTFREMQSESGGETGTNDDVLREAFANVGATIMGRILK